MKRYVLRRGIASLPVLALVVLISFALVRTMAGNAALMALGDDATEQEIADELRRRGLDRPLPEQFAVFVKRVVTLDLPRSVQGDQPIRELIRDAFGVTLKLGLGAFLVAVTVGLGLALVSARWPNGGPDWAARIGSVAGVSVPVFWLAMLLVTLVAVKLGWLPPSGQQAGEFRHWILPCLSLGLVYSASLARVGRAALLEELAKDYCRTARAKGLSEWGVLLHHALPNAMIPVVTVLGSQLAGLLTGAVLTETVFHLPGLGKLFVEAIKGRDSYLLVSVMLLIAVVFVLINFALDVVYAWLDPKVRYGRV